MEDKFNMAVGGATWEIGLVTQIPLHRTKRRNSAQTFNRLGPYGIRSSQFRQGQEALQVGSLSLSEDNEKWVRTNETHAGISQLVETGYLWIC